VDRETWKRRRRAWQERWLFRLQLLRLRLERVLGGGRQPRVVATACWSFPIYSQTFVYQELTQLIHSGATVRFLYSELSRDDAMPPQFEPLWRARRRLPLDPSVCEASYAHFAARMPDRIESLVTLLAGASGLTPDAVRAHYHFRQAFAFARMAEACGPDYLHSYFFYEGTLFAFVASYLLRIPRGVSCYADHMLDDYPLKVVGLHLRQSSIVIATSQRIKAELLTLEPRTVSAQILVKPNGINTAAFPALPREAPRPGQPLELVTVSRIEPKKGLIHMADAIALIRERGIPVEWHIVGGVDDADASRAYAAELEDRIRARDLGGCVHLDGRLSESAINARFRTAHLFVAPFVETATGDKDGIPTALLEAMSSGLPVVGTDAGSIREVIDPDQNGVIVAQRDPRALADAIVALSADPDRQAALGREAARTVRARFDATSGERVFHERLRQILTARAGASPGPTPRVSVIIIFLDAERFLGEAIESVFLQSYDDWELLLVDDGSRDGSTALARGLAARHPGRVRYFEHPDHRNLGMSPSRNLGITHAAGEFVAFLDADDVWSPVKLTRQVAILDAHRDAGMIFGAAEYWHGWTGSAADRARDDVPQLGIEADRVHPPPTLSVRLHPLGPGTAPCPSDLLVRRDVLTRVGGFEEHFSGEKQLFEDQGFLAKVYLSEPVYVASESWIRYRIHPASCTSRVASRGDYRAVRQYFLDWFDQYLQAHPAADAAVARALQAAQEENRGREPGEGAVTKPDKIDLGMLRRLSPFGPNWGFERGLPVDRYYIEQFLSGCAADIHGHVLEIEDNVYTMRYGGDRVSHSDILHVVDGNPRATIVGDLTSADHIPSGAFDCIVLTQVLQLIYDTRAALRTLHRILKPGGVLLATFPGLSRISHREWGGSWFWLFTTASSQRLLDEAFPGGRIRVEAHGNVLTSAAFLYGLAAEDLRRDELDFRDADYELLITVRAEKAPTSS
jgi:glycosyltransferase involved in cell wall biosynthesis/SAM-dependent methyltransferase